MAEIRFVDTTLRDGQMSLWAMSMRTGMMLPVLEFLDRAGFEAIEIIAPAFFKKCVRELREDPWLRLRLARERVTRTPLRAICGRYMAAFQITPRAVRKLLMARFAAHGIQEVRISDPSNTVSCWQEAIEDAREAGLRPIINLIFSISPKHTDEYYAQRTREASRLDVSRLCIKDPGGLLTPERTRSLVRAVLTESNGIPVEFHTHCNTGLGPLCCLEAVRAGVEIVNVAIPPLANGSSNPSVFSVSRNLRGLGYHPRIDEDVLKPVSDHLTFIARLENLPMGIPAEYDAGYYRHQVPGGMISNLRHQLAQMGREHLLEAVLEEIAQVRAELGYPIMVTPYSQFVGVQATMNVLLGERYKEVTDEVIQYALGLWGEEEASSIDPNIRDRILDRPRARELARWQPPEPSIEELRTRLGGPGLSDDELLLRYFAGAADVAAMKAAGPPREYVGVHRPLMALLAELVRRGQEYRSISIERNGFSLRLERCLQGEGATGTPESA